MWKRAQAKAKKFLDSPEELIDLTKKADRLSGKLKSGPMSELLDDLKALLRLIRAYAKGTYRDVPVESMVLVVGAVIYVVSPIDVIPDFVAGVGWLDDAAILGLVLRIVRDEIEDFKEWEATNASGSRKGASK